MRARTIALATLVALLTASGDSPARGRKRSQPLLTLPLHLRVAICQGKLARDAAWVAKHVAAVRRIYRRHRLRVVVTRDTFRPARCVLLTRAHRHAMAVHAPSGPWATVLVLPRVRDVDVPTYDLMGVHWRYRGRQANLRGRRYVLLTARARPPVLAHELSHFLGLRHDPAGGNLLTPGPSDPAWKKQKKPAPFKPHLTARQAKRLRQGLRALLRSAGTSLPIGRGRASGGGDHRPPLAR